MVAQQSGVVVVETRKFYANHLLLILQSQMLRGVILESRELMRQVTLVLCCDLNWHWHVFGLGLDTWAKMPQTCGVD